MECDGHVVYWVPEFSSLPEALAPIAAVLWLLLHVWVSPEAGRDTGQQLF